MDQTQTESGSSYPIIRGANPDFSISIQLLQERLRSQSDRQQSMYQPVAPLSVVSSAVCVECTVILRTTDELKFITEENSC